MRSSIPQPSLKHLVLVHSDGSMSTVSTTKFSMRQDDGVLWSDHDIHLDVVGVHTCTPDMLPIVQRMIRRGTHHTH